MWWSCQSYKVYISQIMHACAQTYVFVQPHIEEHIIAVVYGIVLC